MLKREMPTKPQNKKIDKGGYYEIVLENRGGEAVAIAKVDKTDYDKIKKRRWCLRSARHRYAVNNTDKMLQMHRIILGLENCDQYSVVDHKNQDGLDNRRKNLRIVSRSLNGHNSNKARGYYLDKRRGTYNVEIMIDGKRKRLSGIETEAKAKKIREELLLKVWET